MTELEVVTVVDELKAALAETIEKLDDAADRPPRLLCEKSAAKYLGISPRTLRNWRDEGEGPEFLQLEGKEKLTRYDIYELDKWISEHPRRKERKK